MRFQPRPTSAAVESPQVRSRNRAEIPDRFKWNLDDIFPDWDDVGGRLQDARSRHDRPLRGAEGHARAAAPTRLLDAFRLSEELGQLAYRVWYYPSLQYDEDQRDNTINARRQQVQILFARLEQAESWFNPELLAIPLETVRGWMDAQPDARGSTGSRSRISTASRSTCSTRRASS